MRTKEQREIEIKAWMKGNGDEYGYMPKNIADFHDQKDLFKEIHGHYNHPVIDKTNWVDSMQYVVDVFLWHMAKNGYTLQKNRSKVFKQLKAEQEH